MPMFKTKFASAENAFAVKTALVELWDMSKTSMSATSFSVLAKKMLISRYFGGMIRII